MENICFGDSKVLAEDGPYPDIPEYMSQTKTVFNTVTSNGLFKFTINDSFGDGLCCDFGNGGYTITYGTEKIQSDFGKESAAAFQETKEFGSEAKCPVSLSCSLHFTYTDSHVHSFCCSPVIRRVKGNL